MRLSAKIKFMSPDFNPKIENIINHVQIGGHRFIVETAVNLGGYPGVYFGPERDTSLSESAAVRLVETHLKSRFNIELELIDVRGNGYRKAG